MKKFIQHYFFFLATIAVSVQGFAQTKILTGTVTSESMVNSIRFFPTPDSSA